MHSLPIRPATLFTTALGQPPRGGFAEASDQGFTAIAALVRDPEAALRDIGVDGLPRVVVQERLVEGRAACVMLFFSPPDHMAQPQVVTCTVQVHVDAALVHCAGPMTVFDGPIHGFPGDLFATRLRVPFEVGVEDVGQTLRFNLSVHDPLRQITVPLSLAACIVPRLVQ